ncbi:thrombospondin-type laminin G domain and EAR repeat-containing protein-like [Argopecten irradians]|uniref:thrombospondin-type laminin G domain and EAR repeat-containing protein-like n=1 Tax=Argopecten irradians TaxID=31199 RepID=UPI003718BB6E
MMEIVWMRTFQTLVLLAIVRTVSGSIYRNPCAGLMSADLVEEAIPVNRRLPVGVKVVYDTKSHVHAFEFNEESADVQLNSQDLFQKCSKFPEEFSIFFVIKHRRVYGRKKCVLRVRNQLKPILSISLTNKYIILVYNSRSVKFRNTVLLDNKWHTVGISVTGSDVIMTTDCRNRKRKRLKRKFPANIPFQNGTFQIGSCKAGSGVIRGVLKDLVWVPGADAVRRACPPRVPRHTHMDNRLPSIPELYGIASPGPRWEDCTWMDVGNVAYDLHAESLKVCVNGIWQQLSVNEPVKPPPRPKRLDYLEFYQDLRTPGPSIDVEVFTIPGEGMFAVFANSGRKRPDVSGLYKWTDKTLTMYQRLKTDMAQAWEFFTIDDSFFLAVANYGHDDGILTNSTIFKWQRRKRKFKEYQQIPTYTARDFEYFMADGTHYLAVANHAEGNSQHTESVIYVWNSTTQAFQERQRLDTVGAYDWTHFKVGGYTFLALAQAFDGLTTQLDSRVYILQDEQFFIYQTMETNGATDWEMFTIGETIYMAVANAYNYGPQNFSKTRTYYTNSTIYRLNTKKRAFERFQNIDTYSAVDWEFFTVGDDNFLLVSNAQNGGEERELKSTMYRWQGLDGFVPVHVMTTLPNSDWEVFTDGDDTYFIYTNAKGRNSQILKARFYS